VRSFGRQSCLSQDGNEAGTKHGNKRREDTGGNSDGLARAGAIRGATRAFGGAARRSENSTAETKKGTYVAEPEGFVVDPPVAGPVLAGVLAPVAPGLEAGPVGVVPLVELPGVPVYRPS
jgi:hypothetical protein